MNEVLESLDGEATQLPHEFLVGAIRSAIDRARAAISCGDVVPSIHETVQAAIDACIRPSQIHVINATGVVLHTNLGRAPLSGLVIPGGYSNLEYDVTSGERSKRDNHVSRLLEAILGKPAITVNNGAGALFLVLNELASGGEAIVSRGELIEIGDGFRIPEIMARSGAALCEVGTTNRTHISDYRNAITERTRVLLRVHPSNFKVTGFTARPELSELITLGRERRIPVYEDLGSGCIVDLSRYGVEEPLVQNSLKAGVDLVSFSGDKLLGGPQAGIIAGDVRLVHRVRRNPLFRAFRQDKLIHHAMERTLRSILLGRYNEVLALGMIQLAADEIHVRAEALATRIPAKTRIERGESVIGGGATPEQPLPTWLVVLERENAHAEAARLRANNPPIITRIENDRVVIDLRTVFPEEEELLIQALS